MENTDAGKVYCGIYYVPPTYWWVPDNLWHWQAAMAVLWSLGLHPIQVKARNARYSNEQYNKWKETHG